MKKKIKNIKLNKTTSGFTLVEALFAIFILTFVIVGLMTVVASSLYSSRYARQEIVMNFLLQEAADAIRNDRDTRVFLEDYQWEVFVQDYKNECEQNGCILKIDPTKEGEGFIELEKCNTCNLDSPKSDQSTLYFNDEGNPLMYHHEKKYDSVDSGIKRVIRAYEDYHSESDGEKELIIEIEVSWNRRKRSTRMSLLDWRPPQSID